MNIHQRISRDFINVYKVELINKGVRYCFYISA